MDDGCGSGISGVFCRLGTVGNIVKNLPVVIPTAFLVIIVTLVASLASLLASAVKFFFIWFAKEAINIPVNSENPFVEQGFHISLTIVNSLFVLILVIIGLATILRFQRYQFQKLLPTFFIVALLINFSGVFVGFIVDIGNILTNVFLSRIASFETVAQQVGSLGGDLLSFVSSPGFDELFGNLVEIIAKSVILLVYNAILLIVLLILLLIFVVRASILSLLAVLSPLAFAAYILPATRGFFEQWWKQLIQWSFIGAPIAFFLYLSNLFLTTGGGFPKGGLEGAGALGEVIYGIITPLASLILLIAGIGISMQMAPAGAQGVINFGKKWGAVAGKYAGAQTLGRALATKKGADAAKNLTKTGLGVLSRKELGARWKDAGFLGKAGLAARFAVNPSLVSMRWGIRQAGKQALQYGAKQPQAIDRRVGEFEKQFGKDYDRAAATYATLGSLDYEGKIALALYLAKVKGG
ncbi:MAG: hypothetical protein Q8P03_00010, partial [bacterium]|nr:hypothetical protein [bacterium]